MPLKKNEKRLLPVLGIAMVVLILNFMGLLGGKKKPQTVQQTVKSATSAVKTAATGAAQAIEGTSAKTVTSRRHFSAWGRDPFTSVLYERQASAQRSRSAVPRLKGILWRGNKPFCLINDEIYELGVEKKGIIIDAVEGKKVTGRKGGQPFTLYWSE
jgi:hypothetical protein